ncbi:MAG: DEAD/DEAH box helicase [Candidatus Heimdallarchaeaceae archaeon]
MKITDLSKFGISNSVITKLTELKYEDLTEIQSKAIEAGLFDHKSLIVSAPTGTGKTFIGELAILSASTKKELGKTFLTVPLKALAEEKFEDFTQKYEDWGLKIAISTADRKEFDEELPDYDVIISTYEKLNSLLIRRPGLIENIGLVIVDEFQNIGDEYRGLIIELLLTRVLLAQKDSIPQIIGLSATIPNAESMAKWIHGELVSTEKRDVELREGILYTGEKDINFLGNTLSSGDYLYKEYNAGNIGVEKNLNISSIEKIAKISQQEQTIVFSNTQNKARKIAENIANGFPKTSETENLISELDSRVESTPSTRTLKKVLQNGVAFHHAGLLPIERSIVENGFDDGSIRIISATTTLSAGVNTPAKNVIILDNETWDRKAIPTSDYKNMAGRAGRIRKKDDFGRAVMFASSEKELEFLWKNYSDAKPEKIESQIPKRRKLDCAILGLFSSGVCNTLDELTMFLTMSYFGHIYYKGSAEEFRDMFIKSIEAEIDNLTKKGLLEKEAERIRITDLGKACAEELLSPDTVLLFYNTLRKNKEKIERTEKLDSLLEGIIHLSCCSMDSSRLFMPRSSSEQEELKAIWEVNRESFLYEPRDHEQFITSLRTSRMIMRWIDGLPLNDLSGYAPHGTIKRTAENLSWVISGLSRIARKPLFDFEKNVSQYIDLIADRVFYGVPQDAVPIMRLRIPAVHRYRATKLAESGFISIDDLISASISELTSVQGIGESLALRIKERVERYITDEITRNKERQIRKAKELGRNSDIIDRLYSEKGTSFEKECTNIFATEIGLDAVHSGDIDLHGPDILVHVPEGVIVIECKRKENKHVPAREAEEILGKGASFKPIANVTIGFPDFVEEAQKNVKHTNITLMKASILGEILLKVWEGQLSKDDVISILRSGQYVNRLSEKKSNNEFL